MSLGHSTITRDIRKTPVDHIIGHLSLIYDMVYSESFKIMTEQGYYDKLSKFRNNNDETNRQIEMVVLEAYKYIDDKTKNINSALYD